MFHDPSKPLTWYEPLCIAAVYLLVCVWPSLATYQLPYSADIQPQVSEGTIDFLASPVGRRGHVMRIDGVRYACSPEDRDDRWCLHAAREGHIKGDSIPYYARRRDALAGKRAMVRWIEIRSMWRTLRIIVELQVEDKPWRLPTDYDQTIQFQKKSREGYFISLTLMFLAYLYFRVFRSLRRLA